MSVAPARNFTRLAIAIVVAALIVGSAVYLSDTSGERTSTLTSDLTSTFTTTLTTTSVATFTCPDTANPSCSGPAPGQQGPPVNVTTSTRPITTTTTAVAPEPQLYNVTFQQTGACSPAVYTVPWSVTLEGRTEAEPPNTPLPIANGSYSAGPEPPSLYTIAFTSVPDGVYQYKIAPSGPFYITSGTITVNGTDLLVPVDGPAVSCTTTTTMT